jgi:LysM repeat protein
MKIHLPKIFTSKPKKKLRATAVRRPLRIATTADYDDLAEPNMKLSRALLIVLLLHVVAVSGIIAFNAIKTHQSVALPVARPPAATTDSSAKTDAATHPASTSKESPRVEIGRATKASTKAAKEDRKPDHAKASSAVADSGKTHVVEKGETPLTIAHKFKVPFDDLLAVNHIDDPRKLQIGQKLIIPAKPKAKKTE